MESHFRRLMLHPQLMINLVRFQLNKIDYFLGSIISSYFKINIDFEKQSALEFLSEDHGLVQKRFLYTGKEQRREAKENYEEKCERSALSRMRGLPRW